MPGSQPLEKSEKVGALKTASSHTCWLVCFSASTFSSSRPTRRSPDRQINNDLPRHALWIIRGNKEGNLKKKKKKKPKNCDQINVHCALTTHKKNTLFGFSSILRSKGLPISNTISCDRYWTETWAQWD